MKFFKKQSTGEWILGSRTIPSGTCIKNVQPDGEVEISTINGLLITSRLPEIFEREDGSNYEDLETFESEVADFFVNAPASTGALKWKTYKALLSQSGEDAPVARVLNQDEPDYLGDIKITDASVDGFTNFFWFENENLKPDLLQVFSGHFVGDGNGVFFMINRDESQDGKILISANDYSLGQHFNFVNADIEIKVRQRGTPPQLLKAETNEDGTQVILTFDKKMSDYALNVRLDGNYIAIVGSNYGSNVPSGCYVEHNVITYFFEDPFSIDDDILFHVWLAFIESLDYGLLQLFDNFPVINNVVEQPEVWDYEGTLVAGNFEDSSWGFIHGEGIGSINPTNFMGIPIVGLVHLNGDSAVLYRMSFDLNLGGGGGLTIGDSIEVLINNNDLWILEVVDPSYAALPSEAGEPLNGRSIFEDGVTYNVKIRLL